MCLRAHPGSLDSWRGICSKSPEHDADHGEAEECSNGRCVAFEVASQATVTTDPRERSFDQRLYNVAKCGKSKPAHESICHRRLRVIAEFDAPSAARARAHGRWRRTWSGARIALCCKCAYRSKR